MKIEYMKGSNVVSIAPVRAQVNFPSIAKVESYWEGLRDGRIMPARAEVDPRGISDVLENAFVLEKIAPGLARIRLAGMHLNELMAMEVRGMPVTAMFLPEARREMQKVLENVMESPAVVRLTLVSEGSLSHRPLEAQMILLPLRDEDGRPTRILGALQAKGEIGRGPRRFSIRDVETKPLLTDDVATRRPRLPAYDEPRPDLRVTGMSETAQPFAPKTMALAEEIRRRQKALDDKAAGRAADAAATTKADKRATVAEEVEKRGSHLHLVHDVDRG